MFWELFLVCPLMLHNQSSICPMLCLSLLSALSAAPLLTPYSLGSNSQTSAFWATRVSGAQGVAIRGRGQKNMELACTRLPLPSRRAGSSLALQWGTNSNASLPCPIFCSKSVPNIFQHLHSSCK